MTEFIRVRQAEGPKHEFDVSIPEYEANKDLYFVVDDTPVLEVRPTDYGNADRGDTEAAPAKQKKPSTSKPKTPVVPPAPTTIPQPPQTTE
jgi:hypothetical protein